VSVCYLKWMVYTELGFQWIAHGMKVHVAITKRVLAVVGASLGNLIWDLDLDYRMLLENI